MRPVKILIKCEDSVSEGSFSDVAAHILRESILQSTLVISTSLILNNRLSGSENLVPILIWKSNKK